MMLEAGSMVHPAEDFKENVRPYELAHHGARIAGVYYNLPYLSEFTAPNAFFTIKRKPDTAAPDSKFLWLRSRIVGGRTDHWARIALRFAKFHVKAGSHDGTGDDWPITYEDLAPYYDKAESSIAVVGAKESIPSALTAFPNLADPVHRTARKECVRPVGDLVLAGACYCWRGNAAGSNDPEETG